MKRAVALAGIIAVAFAFWIWDGLRASRIIL